MASVNGGTVTYDAFGRMAENQNGKFQYVYSAAAGQPTAVMQGQNLAYAYVFLPGGAVAVYNGSGLSQYNHVDWLGSARLHSTPSQTPVAAMSYAPFGEGYQGGQAWVQFTETGQDWTVYNTENSAGSLVDFTYRRYNPTQGRWISPDPAGLAAVDPSNPQSWNRYAYVNNTPLTSTDPTGQFEAPPGSPWVNPDFTGQTGPLDPFGAAPSLLNMQSQQHLTQSEQAYLSWVNAIWLNGGDTIYWRNGNTVGIKWNIESGAYGVNNGNGAQVDLLEAIAEYQTLIGNPNAANNGPQQPQQPQQQQPKPYDPGTFRHPSKEACSRINKKAKVDALIAGGSAATGFLFPPSAIVTEPVAAGEGLFAVGEEAYMAFFCEQ
jgi:RHS repeat-associated protein